MGMYDVFQVARYEIKLLLRTWMFRIVAVFLLIGIAFIQVMTQGVWVVSDWSMIALASSMPWFNAYLFNIVQTLLAVFVSTDLFHRESQGGMLECIHVRPVKNSDYLWGKAGGMVFIFLLLNVISIFICILLNLAGSLAPFNLWYYLFYLLTLTLPSLFFVIGLGMWVSGVARYRYLSQSILIFCVLCSQTVFSGRFHGTLDFSGNGLSNLFSDVTGHPDLWTYLLQRAIYLLLGIGFVFLSIRRMKRIPNYPKRVIMHKIRGIGLLVLGSVVFLCLEMGYVQDSRARAFYRTSVERYGQYVTSHVVHHAIVLEQKKDRLISVSEMKMVNPNQEQLPRLILFLNPGLKVTGITERDLPVVYRREGPVLFVERPLVKGDTIVLKVFYEGQIDERVCDLDLTDNQLSDTGRGEAFFHFGRRAAFVGNNFMLLTPACIWYPVVFPPAFPRMPYLAHRDFTRYDLSVIHPRQRQLFSQGERREEENMLRFVTCTPLPGISLCGGDYDVKYLRLRGVTFELFYFRGHDFFSVYFPHVNEADLQKGFQDGFQSVWDRQYNGRRLGKILSDYHWCGDSGKVLLLETPLSFDAGTSGVLNASDRVLPGMILLPERGVGMYMNLDVRGDLKRRMIKNNSTETEAEVFVCNNWSSSNLLVPELEKDGNNFLVSLITTGKISGDVIRQPNPYYFLPMLCETRVTVSSGEYLLADLMFKLLLQRKTEFVSGTVIAPLSETEWMARVKLRGNTMDEVLADRTLADNVVKKVLGLKSEELLNRLTIEVPRERFFHFLENFYDKCPVRASLDTLASAMRDSLGINLMQVLEAWQSCRHDARFRVKDGQIFTVKNTSRKMGSVKVYNDGQVEGLLSVQSGHFSLLGETAAESYNLFIGPGEAKEIRYTGKVMFFGINTLGYNLPGNERYSPFTDRDIRETDQAGDQAGWQTLNLNISEFAPAPDEIVTDDEDDDCLFTDTKNVWLQRVMRKKESLSDGDQSFRLNATTDRWTRSLKDDAYGIYVKGFHYKMGGKGNAKATWKADIKKPGKYEIMVMAYNRQSDYYTVVDGEMVKQKRDPLILRYKIFYDGKVQELDLEPKKSREWLSLGIYDFSEGEARVELSDKGESYHVIVADAVKWVKMK